MFNGLWRTFLVLVFAVLIALFSGHYLRGMIGKDFQRYLEAERMERLRAVSSDFEGAYEKNKRWGREDLAGHAVRALTLGLRVKVVDARGEVVMDTEKALASLPGEKTARIHVSKDDISAAYQSFPLFMGGDAIGRLDVKFAGQAGENLLMKHSGKFVMVWSFILSGLAIAVGLIAYRMPSGRIREPAPVPSSDAKSRLNPATSNPQAPAGGGPTAGPPVPGMDDGVTRDTPGAKPGEINPLHIAPEVNIPLVADEDNPEAMPEDLTDADDQDMRPLAGDADRITKIVKGLDELKKAQELGRALRKQPVELSQFLNTIVEKTRGPFDDKLVTFSLECERALILTADPDCLMRILANLLDNAAKAVKNDGTVTVSAAAKNDYIEFAIRDTGTGIRPKDLPHIFERFYRASGSGIGLGLTIVKELVDASGGSIEVRTSLGKGSVFTVRLPKS